MSTVPSGVESPEELEREVERRRRELERLEAELERWRERYDEVPKRDDAAGFTTVSGREVEPLHTPLDRTDQDYREDLGFPGEYPFTRGPYHSMYRTKLWTMRQFSGFATGWPSPAWPTWRPSSTASRWTRSPSR